MEQSATRPPPSRNGVALPYLRPLTPGGKWTCPSAVCQLPGLCGKMDPPARRRVGSRCLTRPLLRVRLCPGRQENQRPERPVSSSPTHTPRATTGLAEDPGTPACREWYRQNSPEPSLARTPCPTQGGNQTSRLRPRSRLALFPRYIASSSCLSVPEPRVRHPSGRGLVTKLAPSALARPSFPVPAPGSAAAMGFPPLPGRLLPARFCRNLVGSVRWASQLAPGGTFGRSYGVSSHNLCKSLSYRES